MAGENTAVRLLQGGSVLEVASGGSISILAGGSIQNAGGLSLSGSVAVSGSLSVTGVAGIAVLSAASGTFGGIRATDGTFPGTIGLGGVVGRWDFGTLGLASGVGSVKTALTTVVSAWCNSLSGVQGGLGSMSSAVIDPVNFAQGSVIFRGLAGTLAFTGNNGTVSWAAFGW